MGKNVTSQEQNFSVEDNCRKENTAPELTPEFNSSGTTHLSDMPESKF